MESKKRKKSNRSLFYRIAAWLHLWLGLVTGIVVVIVCLTGCIWCFNEEITDLFDKHSTVAMQDMPVMKPSEIKSALAKKYPDFTLKSYNMREGHSMRCYLSPLKTAKTPPTSVVSMEIRINPYTGSVLLEKKYGKDEKEFFRWVLNGHRFLWLPYTIGRPIVNYSVLVFIVTLLTGLVLWWPKKWNQSTRSRCFKIKWNGTVKRINYDLHNVLGFYALSFLLVIASTGIVWGIQWFAKSTYWLTTGGKSNSEYVRLVSDTANKDTRFTSDEAIDSAWRMTSVGHANTTGFYVMLPDTTTPTATIFITFYPTKGKFYDNQNYVFDQHTLKPLKQTSIYGTPYEQCNPGEKLRKWNYDLHVGSLLGLPGKFLAFCSSLIGASLPVTGLVVWWGRKRRQKRKLPCEI
ncbi:MAG: PepSY-associated TM helix domain-containing protein [Chitinophagaceae bacterium]